MANESTTRTLEVSEERDCVDASIHHGLQAILYCRKFLLETRTV